MVDSSVSKTDGPQAREGSTPSPGTLSTLINFHISIVTSDFTSF